MDNDTKEILKIVRENNKILRGMRSGQRWSSFFQWIYWFVIIGSVLGAYYYVQPMLEPLIGAYDSIVDNIDSVKGSLNDVNNSMVIPKDAIEQIKNTLEF